MVTGAMPPACIMPHLVDLWAGPASTHIAIDSARPPLGHCTTTGRILTSIAEKQWNGRIAQARLANDSLIARSAALPAFGYSLRMRGAAL